MRWLLLAVPLPFLLGCPSTTIAPKAAPPVPAAIGSPSAEPALPAPPAPPAGPTRAQQLADRLAAVEPLRRSARALVVAQHEGIWKVATQRRSFDAAEAWRGRDELLSPDALAKVRAAVELAEGPEARALALLETFLASELVARATATTADERALVESTSVVKVGDDEVVWQDVERTLANIPSASERAKLHAAQAPVLEKLQPLVRESLHAGGRAAQVVGFASRAEFLSRLRETDLDALAALAEQVLVATEESYRSAGTKLAVARFALPLAKLRAADLPRLLAPPITDTTFAADRLVERVTPTAAALGLRIPGQPGLRFEDGESPVKLPRPICVVVDPPTDVRVSARRVAGADATRLLLRAVGQAALAINVDQPSWELRALGSGAVQGAISNLAENRVYSRAWLAASTTLKGAELDAWVRESAVRRLFDLRRTAARVLFALAITKDPSEPEATWRAVHTRALGLEFTLDDAKRWPLDADLWLDSADTLRSRLLAAQLDRHLAAAHGENWWATPATADTIRPIFAAGGTLTVEGLLQKIGALAIDPAVLASQLAGTAP